MVVSTCGRSFYQLANAITAVYLIYFPSILNIYHIIVNVVKYVLNILYAPERSFFRFLPLK